VSTVSPVTLRACAEELRELAGRQRAHAAACETLLDAVRKLDTAETWQGTHPDAMHARFAEWRAGLDRTIDELRGTAASWSSLADDFERRAADAVAGR
jgi:hypothetical protein